ncbi:DUF1741-domain-containing protein [Heliocybe sulcata]|uniref:DUF1741-domain-containing protein n=1 Tax=Heliocybe sulcata TaxID=5364 RepID=A0A5C3NH14_9AGAM|nr:DUF1741-domain-containing protein [Heliocybe sulcata]
MQRGMAPRRNTLQSQSLVPNPSASHERFWSDLLELQVNRDFLLQELSALSKDECLSELKPFLNALFKECVDFARSAAYDDPKKPNSLETLSVFCRCILSKDLTGWEVMEVFTGGVRGSDQFFMTFVEMIDHLIGDQAAGASLRHQVIQLAIIFMCRIAQLSPGAYFLRRDLWPSICDFLKHQDTRQFSFEAALLICLLANFHRSDSAKLNPYVHRIRETVDVDVMRSISKACTFAAERSTKTYQSIMDDSEPTFMSSVGTLITSLRPDRALAAKPVDPPRELFKDQPIEAALALLPAYEFLYVNPVFSSLLLEELHLLSEKPTGGSGGSLVVTLLTLSSYILSHATSSGSARAAAYGNMALHVLRVMVENDAIFRILSKPHTVDIRLCRQRLPALPVQPSPRPPICALLDCCMLWLRHNLHKKLQTSSYIICVKICYRTLWTLRRDGIRLDYHWQELWKAIIALLEFLARDDIVTTGGSISRLQYDTLQLLDFALCNCEALFSSPQSVHECIYELVRSVATLRKQNITPDVGSPPTHHRRRQSSASSVVNHDPLTHILRSVTFYEEKIHTANARSAKEAMRVVAKQVEADGVLGSRDSGQFSEPLKREEDVSGFAKYAALDGLSLMP